VDPRSASSSPTFSTRYGRGQDPDRRRRATYRLVHR
jgi:hypothetical protein